MASKNRYKWVSSCRHCCHGFVIRTEELGEDDISFKMINENATLVRDVVISAVVVVTMLLGVRTTGLGQET